MKSLRHVFVLLLACRLCGSLSNYFQYCKVKFVKRVAAAVFPLLISQSCSAGFLSELNADSGVIPKTIAEMHTPKKSIRAHAYSVEFTDPPCLSPRTLIGERSALDRLVSSDAIVIGKHRGSAKDAELEVNLLSRALEEARSKKRALAVGLVDIPNTEFNQASIDTYLSSKQVGSSVFFHETSHKPNLHPFCYLVL